MCHIFCQPRHCRSVYFHIFLQENVYYLFIYLFVFLTDVKYNGKWKTGKVVGAFTGIVYMILMDGLPLNHNNEH